jgi:hypothetical protein
VDHRLVQAVGWIILGIWALNMVLVAVRSDYQPHFSVHALMLALATAVLTGKKKSD